MKILILSFISVILICLIALISFQLSGKTSKLSFQQPKQVEIKPVTTEPVSLTLNLSSPDDNLLVFDPDLLIQGTTSPTAIVILLSDNKTLALETQKEGSFSTTFKLKEGLNQITITTFDKLGNSKNENRTIYYSPEKI